ncbi:MAG TPA: plastocyanin/azurin family copper-binding protein [Thermomicrobiaceae bacterium]|nr:plastocyanin/azurin family copper-binding protein [Thermomicrobiaceae bacterium]
MKVWYRGMGKVLVLLAAAAVLAVTLAACGGSGGSSNSGSSGSSNSINVTETEFKITPNTFSAKAGKVTFVIKNAGTVQHDITVDVNGKAESSPLVNPGQTATWTTTSSLTAGTYQVYCSVPGHRQAGMTATLTVS